MQIAERVNKIAASQSLEMAARAKAMKAAGIDVISMSLGEPDMDTPEHIRRAAQEAIENGWSHYGPVAGIESLREAIAEQANRPNQKYKNIDKPSCTAINIDKEEIKNAHSTSAMPDGLRGLERNHPQALTNELAAPVDANTPNLLPEEQHVEYLQKCDLPSYKNDKNEIEWTASDVIVSVGAKMAIYNAIQTAVNPGDEVIIPMPSWVSYSEMVKLAGGTVVPVQTRYEDRYCLTPEQLRKALTPKTRMLILCSPNNPTGSVYSREELEALVEVLREWPEVIVLSDEIYNALVYGQPSNPLTPNPLTFSAFGELADRLIIVNGVSKAYAMTGYRIGWLLCKNKAFIAACTRLQGQQLTCATMVAQKAAEAALRGTQECVEQMRSVFASRRELICRLAKEIPGWKFEEPQGAFYLFPDVSALGGGDVYAKRLLEKAHVAVVPGSAFGCPECIRLSYAISTEEIKEAMKRIGNL